MNGNWNCSSSCLLSTVLTSFTKNGQVLCQSGGVGTNHCLLLDFQSLCLISPAQFPQSFVVLEWEKERETVGETFVCKTCRGRSIHPFQKNNITFKWNGLEPPNPIFEPRSLSRTFPFWIFHSEVEEGPHLIGDYPPSILSRRCKNYPDHLSPSAEENYPAFQTILIKLFFCIFLFQICDWYFSFRWWYIKSIWEIKSYILKGFYSVLQQAVTADPKLC